jgi:hypothetical protein
MDSPKASCSSRDDSLSYSRQAAGNVCEYGTHCIKNPLRIMLFTRLIQGNVRRDGRVTWDAYNDCNARANRLIGAKIQCDILGASVQTYKYLKKQLIDFYKEYVIPNENIMNMLTEDLPEGVNKQKICDGEYNILCFKEHPKTNGMTDCQKCGEKNILYSKEEQQWKISYCGNNYNIPSNVPSLTKLKLIKPNKPRLVNSQRPIPTEHAASKPTETYKIRILNDNVQQKPISFQELYNRLDNRMKKIIIDCIAYPNIFCEQVLCNILSNNTNNTDIMINLFSLLMIAHSEKSENTIDPNFFNNISSLLSASCSKPIDIIEDRDSSHVGFQPTGLCQVEDNSYENQNAISKLVQYQPTKTYKLKPVRKSSERRRTSKKYLEIKQKKFGNKPKKSQSNLREFVQAMPIPRFRYSAEDLQIK